MEEALASTRHRRGGPLAIRAGVGLTALATLGTTLLLPAPPAAGEASRREKILERLRERLSDPSVDRPLLHAHQVASLDYVYYRPNARGQEEALEVALPDDAEVKRFLAAREGGESEALDLLDEFYGRRDTLKALAVRDRDDDGTPDYRVSDYYGKLSEGDVDVDGDGVRNVYDAAPYDPSQGGRDDDGDGIPDSGFVDTNGNALPDHVDWALQGKDREMAEIQLGLFRDHKILLVERDARFDLPLARAADDVVRRVFRACFEKSKEARAYFGQTARSPHTLPLVAGYLFASAVVSVPYIRWRKRVHARG